MGLSTDQIVTMMKQYNEGVPLREIAGEFEVSPNTVLNVRRRLGLPTRRSRQHGVVMTAEVEAEARARLAAE